jgi:hypothetical protein
MMLRLAFIATLLLLGSLVEAFLPKTFVRFNRVSHEAKSLVRTFLTTADFKNGMTLEIGEKRLVLIFFYFTDQYLKCFLFALRWCPREAS